MRGVVFKNLGQNFSSIIHTADLDSDSLFASCAASSRLPAVGDQAHGESRIWSSRRQGRDRATGAQRTQGEHNITLEIPCVPRRARCPSLKTH